MDRSTIVANAETRIQRLVDLNEGMPLAKLAKQSISEIHRLLKQNTDDECFKEQINDVMKDFDDQAMLLAEFQIGLENIAIQGGIDAVDSIRDALRLDGLAVRFDASHIKPKVYLEWSDALDDPAVLKDITKI